LTCDRQRDFAAKALPQIAHHTSIVSRIIAFGYVELEVLYAAQQ